MEDLECEGRGGVLQPCLQDQAEELDRVSHGLHSKGADKVWVETKLDSQSVRIVCSIAQYRHQCWEVRHSQLPGHGRGGGLWGGVRSNRHGCGLVWTVVLPKAKKSSCFQGTTTVYELYITAVRTQIHLGQCI